MVENTWLELVTKVLWSKFYVKYAKNQRTLKAFDRFCMPIVAITYGTARRNDG